MAGRARSSGEPARLIRAYKHGWPAGRRGMIRRGSAGFFRSAPRGSTASALRCLERPGGALFLANHSCWWDLFLAHILNEAIPVDGYGMMEHFNLLRFGFFRRIGAFSVDRTDPRRSGRRSSTRPGLLSGRARASGSSPREDRRERRPPAGLPGRDSGPGPRAGPGGSSPSPSATNSGRTSGPRRSSGSASRPGSRPGAAAVVVPAESRVTDELDALRDDVLAQGPTDSRSCSKADVDQRPLRPLVAVPRPRVRIDPRSGAGYDPPVIGRPDFPRMRPCDPQAGEPISWSSLLVAVFALRASRADQPIVENYVGRQVPTAMVARNLERGSGFLAPSSTPARSRTCSWSSRRSTAELAAWCRRLGHALERAGRLVSALDDAGGVGTVRPVPGARGDGGRLLAVVAFAVFPVTIRYGGPSSPMP